MPKNHFRIACLLMLASVGTGCGRGDHPRVDYSPKPNPQAAVLQVPEAGRDDSQPPSEFPIGKAFAEGAPLAFTGSLPDTPDGPPETIVHVQMVVIRPNGDRSVGNSGTARATRSKGGKLEYRLETSAPKASGTFRVELSHRPPGASADRVFAVSELTVSGQR